MQDPNIYFVGRAGAGKSFLTRYLIENHGYIQGKMACSLYGIAKVYFGMEEKNKDRKLLQYMGTEIGRGHIDTNIWVERFLEDIYLVEQTYKDLYNKNIKFCSDDVRFQNEHKALKGEGWVGIYLDVPDELRIERLRKRDGNAQENTLQHSSETALDEFKDELIKVDVSGTLEQSYQNLENVLNEIKEKNNVTN